GLLEPAERRETAGAIRLRRLRAAAVHVRDEVRQRHGLAELLHDHPGSFRDEARFRAVLAAHRVPLCALRRTPWPRVRRRPAADSRTVVQQRSRVALRRGGGPPITPRKTL